MRNRILRTSLVLVAVGLVLGCSRLVVIDSDPGGADLQIVTSRDHAGRKLRTPIEVKLKERRHDLVLEADGYETTRTRLEPEPLSFFEKYFLLQGLFREGKLASGYTIPLRPSFEMRVRRFAQHTAQRLAGSVPFGRRGVAVFPYTTDGHPTELGRLFATELAMALQTGPLALSSRVLRFNDVQRYLVENDQALGAGALTEGDDIAHFANQQGVDLIVVGRIRREGGSRPVFRFETIAIDPQSAQTLAILGENLPPMEGDGGDPRLAQAYQTVSEPPPSLRAEVRSTATRLAQQMWQDYAVDGPGASVRFNTFEIAPGGGDGGRFGAAPGAMWADYASEEFRKAILNLGRGRISPVVDEPALANMGFDPMRAQPSDPRLLAGYQFIIYGDIREVGDQVVMSAHLSQLDGTVMISVTSAFRLATPAMRKEWRLGGQGGEGR